MGVTTVVVEIKDSKVGFVMEVLKAFPFVKVRPLSEGESKKALRKKIETAVKEMRLIKAGKLKGIPARQLLNEL